MKPTQKGRHFPDDIFICIFLNENVGISINISLNFVPTGPINIILALVQIMDWHWPGDKPLSAPMMVDFLSHICVTRLQCANTMVITCIGYQKVSLLNHEKDIRIVADNHEFPCYIKSKIGVL